MNEKFFALPEEKRLRMMNAGFHVFAQNSYKKSPVSEIASAAGISKSLLFHYFRNKRELYLFLWNESARITIEAMKRHRCYEQVDFFELMRRGLRAKMELTRRYPEMAIFAIKAFYEKDPEVHGVIAKSYNEYLQRKAYGTLASLRPEDFRPGIDLTMMYREMFWASEGYVWELVQRGTVDADRMERDFEALIAFWEKTYGAEKGKETTV